jgi:hypothetical protein
MSQDKTAKKITDLLTTQLAIPEPNIMTTQDHQGIPWLLIEAVDEDTVPDDSPWYVNTDLDYRVDYCAAISVNRFTTSPSYRYPNHIYNVWSKRFFAPSPKIWCDYQAPLKQALLDELTHGPRSKNNDTPTWLMGNRDHQSLWSAIQQEKAALSNPLNKNTRKNNQYFYTWDGIAFSIPACQNALSNGQNPLEPWLTYAISKMQGTIDKINTFIQDKDKITNTIDIQNAKELINSLNETEEALTNNQCTSGSTTQFQWLTSDNGEIFFIPNNKLINKGCTPIITIEANLDNKKDIDSILNQFSGVETRSIINQKDNALYQIVMPARNQDRTTDPEQLYATLRFLLDYQRVQTTIALKNATQFYNRNAFEAFVSTTLTSITIPEPCHKKTPFQTFEEQLQRCTQLQEMFKTASFSR